MRLLEGTFGYAAQALTLFPPPAEPPNGPSPIGAYAPFVTLAFAGTNHFDGKGNHHGANVVNLNFGGIPRTYEGTYAVVDPNVKPTRVKAGGRTASAMTV